MTATTPVPEPGGGRAGGLLGPHTGLWTCKSAAVLCPLRPEQDSPEGGPGAWRHGSAPGLVCAQGGRTSAGRLRGLLACDPRGSYTRTCANTSSRESWATGDLVVMLERERPLRAGCKPQKPQRKDHQPDRCNHTAKYLKPGKAFAINKTHED